MSDPLSMFGPAARRWFASAFAAPTEVQTRGWASIATGRHTLLLAPTGSGKTLAAFLWALDRLSNRPLPDADEPVGVRVLYVSPLKALVYDIERNLRAPLVGLQRAAAAADRPFRPVSVSVRTGDTSQKDRAAFSRRPGDVLVTTPESLYLLLTSAARETLRTVETVIVDEIHAVAGTKRGVHLALSLERLAALGTAAPGTGVPMSPAGGPQRIGLSATQRPLDEIARFLGGDRPVEIIDASAPPLIDLQVVVPVVDMDAPDVPAEVLSVDQVRRGADVGARGPDAASGGSSSLSMDRSGVWPAIHPRLLALIRAHHSTIVFCNSRRLCERLAARLNELAGEDLVAAHHGSISRSQRTETEDALKSGKLPCIVATSSLELGIDMGAVDLVIQIESPGAVSRGLQRIGRAGHGVGEVSVGRIFPKFRGDLLETAVVVQRMLAGEIEPTVVPRNCLDVLAQHVVSMVSMDDWPVEAIGMLVRRAYPYRELAESALLGTLEMLAGRYPHAGGGDRSEELFADLRPRVAWDRSEDVLRARRGSRSIAVANAGTIPDRGLFGVYLGEGGPRVGELDEEMVYESRTGDVVVLGASSWRVVEIKRDRLIVSPAPGEPGRLPFWRGEGPGRPADLGRAMGAFVRELDARMVAQSEGEDPALTWLEATSRLDALAAANLCKLLADQKAETGTLPTDRAITVERFRDELGDWRVCILSLLGSRVNAPWALALEAYLSQQAGFDVEAMWSDDGIVLRIADADEAPELGLGGDGALVLDPDEVEDLVVSQLQRSGVFAARFRENAARALLLARRRPGSRTPLWAQRLRSQNLLAVAGQFPDFPVVLETFRECLHDVFDIKALVGLMADIRGRRVRVEQVETRSASPFARGLVYQYIGSYLYEGDAPLAERRAAALAIDRNLLRELLGQEELRDLLDSGVMTEVEAELQGLADHRRARDADELHDLLRRVGDLSEREVVARSADDPAPWLARLAGERRAAAVRVAGERRWIAAEDIGRYRDALGVPAPAGMPDPFLIAGDTPFESLLLRYGRSHAPFTTGELARRYALQPAQVSAVLRALEARGVLLLGEFRPSGWRSVAAAGQTTGLAEEGREWCDPQVLQRLRRRTLARLRNAIAPVEAEALGRFLPDWHGIAPVIEGPLGTPAVRRRGGAELSAVFDAVIQLEGLAVAFSELEGSFLPARVAGYRPELLDELGASGQIVWVGAGRLGARDGRVALFRRESVGMLLDRPSAAAGDGLRLAILAHLDRRGASFFTEIQLACPEVATAPLEEALWDLVWEGLVTNDTLHPLRALSGPRRRGSGRTAAVHRGQGRPRVSAAGLGRSPVGGPRSGGAVGGRWSAVVSLLPGDSPDETTRAHARSLMLLERYGVVVREAALSEELPGGFQAVYGVLRAMEESGAVRRGYFVEGPGGAQFALPGAVDRLRDARVESPRATDDPGPACVLSAADPANPYGALLAWPESGAARSPRRSTGSRVVLVDGAPALYLEAGSRGLMTFPAATDDSVLRRAVAALVATSARSLRIERVDGGAALACRHLPRLLAAGFSRDHTSLLLPVPL